MPEVVLQNDFRKVSGITSEVFRQIEAIEKDYDAITAANFEAVEKRGDMIIRLLDPRALGRAGVEASRKYLCSEVDGNHSVQFIEIIKRPGQTLGLYIREGDGFRLSDGVFISRIALESAVYNSGLLKIGDEILAANLVDVRNMSLDDVVIIMSIPRRLVLTIRSKNNRFGNYSSNAMTDRSRYEEDYNSPPVVVFKKDLDDENYGNDELSENRDSENEGLIQSRVKDLTSEASRISLHHAESDPYHEYSDPYYSRSSLMRMPFPLRDESLTSLSRRAELSSKAYKPFNMARTRHLDKLSASPKVYPSYFFNGRSNTLQSTRLPFNRFLTENMSPLRSKLFSDYDNSWLRRRPRFLRTESDNRIHLSSDYNFDPYLRSNERVTFRAPSSLDYSHIGNFRSSLSSQGISSLSERRPILDGSMSDTELDGLSRSFHLRSKNLKKYPTLRGLSLRDPYQIRSSSLPRPQKLALSSNYGYLDSIKRPLRGQSVKFEKQRAYSSWYDDDSDGAASAPELPEGKHKRLGNKFNLQFIY